MKEFLSIQVLIAYILYFNNYQSKPVKKSTQEADQLQIKIMDDHNMSKHAMTRLTSINKSEMEGECTLPNWSRRPRDPTKMARLILTKNLIDFWQVNPRQEGTGHVDLLPHNHIQSLQTNCWTCLHSHLSSPPQHTEMRIEIFIKVLSFSCQKN